MENPQLNSKDPDAFIRAVLKASEPDVLSHEAYARMLGAVQGAVRPAAAPVRVRPLLDGKVWWGVGVLALVMVVLGLWLPGSSGDWQLPLPSLHAMRLALIVCLTAWAALLMERRMWRGERAV
jgi:hypothetical protein